MFHNVETRLFLSVIRISTLDSVQESPACPTVCPSRTHVAHRSTTRRDAAFGHAVGRAGDRRTGVFRRLGALARAHRDRPRRRPHPQHGAPPAARADRRRLRRAGADDRALPAGIGIAVLGQRALEHSGYHLARPCSTNSAPHTGESVSLGIRRGHEVVVIERASAASPLRFDHPTGAEIAMHASAMGKVLLAFSRRARSSTRSRTLGRSNGSPTLPTRRSTRADRGTRTCRRRGYATNIEERHVGVCGIAAPVRSRSGIAHAAVRSRARAFA